LRFGAIERIDGAFRACHVNSELKSHKSENTIQIDEDKDFVQIVLGDDRFAVDREELVAFIRQKGRSLGSEIKVE
jgi:hypothetical protein